MCWFARDDGVASLLSLLPWVGYPAFQPQTPGDNYNMLLKLLFSTCKPQLLCCISVPTNTAAPANTAEQLCILLFCPLLSAIFI